MQETIPAPPTASLFVIGMNHRTAPVTLREQFAISPELRERTEKDLLQENTHTEQVLLSTCNRIEIYGVCAQGAPDAASFFPSLHDHGLDPSSFSYRMTGDDAFRHLIRVVSGMDSMVLGESEIASQVKQAYERARQAGRTSRCLNKVFQVAFQAAKAIRTQTRVCVGATSLGAVCARQAGEHFPDPSSIRVLVMGAGAMSESGARHLYKKGFRNFTVTNRSAARAERLAEILEGETISFENRLHALGLADIVLSATSADEPVVTLDAAAPVLRGRKDEKLLMFDLGVPRDLEPALEKIPEVELFDLDRIQSEVHRFLHVRQKDTAVAESLIEEHLAALHVQLVRGSPAPPPSGIQLAVDTPSFAHAPISPQKYSNQGVKP